MRQKRTRTFRGAGNPISDNTELTICERGESVPRVTVAPAGRPNGSGAAARGQPGFRLWRGAMVIFYGNIFRGVSVLALPITG